jgi:AmmeMemoRadiSam system protein A
MSSTESPARLDPEQRRTLLQVARRSIAHGLQHGRPLAVDVADFHPDLATQRACFVTLNLRGDLRGCIGHLEAVQPLVVDVAENAFAAAFRDPRFPPLRADEWPEIQLHISVLSPAEPMQFSNEEDLLAQLQPGKDGLILVDGPFRGTFLPSVWETLPRPADFLSHLKAKAGLPADHWSQTLQVSRYRTESFGDE